MLNLLLEPFEILETDTHTEEENSVTQTQRFEIETENLCCKDPIFELC